MIRFLNVNNEERVLTIDKKDQDELNENAMLTYDVAAALATSKAQFDQLYVMLDSVPDFSIKMPADRFEKLNVGYGLVNHEVTPIVIYRTSKDVLSFIMYKDEHVTKIYPESGDIFTVSFSEAVEEKEQQTRQNLARLQRCLENTEEDQKSNTTCSFRNRCMDCCADCDAATQQAHEKFLESLKPAEYPVCMNPSDKAIFDMAMETVKMFLGQADYKAEPEAYEQEPAEEDKPGLDSFVENFGSLVEVSNETEDVVNELTKCYEQIHELEKKLASLLAKKVKLQCMADENFKSLCK